MEIYNIEQLLPFVAMRPEFEVRHRDGFSLIDYDYQTQTTFDIPELMECRGIKFCPQGLILARPFKKFFNYGEKGSGLPLHRSHHVTKKMDGSMIHAILLERRLFFHSRGGYTDVAKKAELFVLNSPQHRYVDFCRFQLTGGWTPIFEFTAPHNRIVLRYEEEALTLIGLRHMVSGQLCSYEGLKMTADMHDVPVVESLGRIMAGSIPAFVAHTRGLKDEEGYVVHFDDGYLVKIKADEYVHYHRSLDDIGTKKRVVILCCAGGLDDVLPVIAPLDAAELLAFNEAFQEEVNVELTKVVKLTRNYDALLNVKGDPKKARKTFAYTCEVNDTPKPLRNAAFAMIDGKDPRRYLLKNFSRNPKTVKAEWRGQ